MSPAPQLVARCLSCSHLRAGTPAKGPEGLAWLSCPKKHQRNAARRVPPMGPGSTVIRPTLRYPNPPRIDVVGIQIYSLTMISQICYLPSRPMKPKGMVQSMRGACTPLTPLVEPWRLGISSSLPPLSLHSTFCTLVGKNRRAFHVHFATTVKAQGVPYAPEWNGRLSPRNL